MRVFPHWNASFPCALISRQSRRRGNPAEMPYFQESHRELVIHIKAAKELGLEIPAGLVARADRVVE